jgi:ankyrin repeat protein
MLSVSHGRLATARLLVSAGAGVNIQDEDGSTALMCAAEHGHKQIIRWMLTLPDIDASLTDYVCY